MTTIQRNAIEVDVQAAPSTPLNLRFGVVYAPREASTVFAGFSAVEVEPDVFAIGGFQFDGGSVELWRGPLSGAWHRLAGYLGMTRG